MSVDQPVIYDFGMNNGDDVEYYLLKCPRVVGVEANERLCAEVRKRFAMEIEDGRLIIVNAVLSETDGGAPTTFYIHKLNHLLSQLPRPSDDQIDQFEAVEAPCRTPASIVQEFGAPRYVKVDVEHFDQEVLKNLFAAGIFPLEISAEAHSIEVFAHLVANGYNSFSLVDGKTVLSRYADATIRTLDGPRQFSFKHHSAGPFGEDIKGRWEDRETFFHTLADAGLGWKDIHASKLISPEPPASNWTLAGRRFLSLARKVGVAIKWRTIDRISGSAEVGKLTLVLFSREYLDLSWDWLRDPEVKVMTMAGDFSRDDQERFFESLPERHDYKIWGVESPDGTPIGAAGLKHIDGRDAEFWCYIGERTYWGQGLGGRILEACEEEAPALGVSRLRMTALEDNERSLRAYEKMGFEFVSRDGEAGTVTLAKSL